MPAPVLMVQGTTSHAGKSVLVAGLCRVFARRGYSVAPFKSQNMALNSAVTPEGAEIGRAQAFQAAGAGVEPHADMNPVLLKPCSPTGSQVIVLGTPVGVMQVREYHGYQAEVWPLVTEALDRLRGRFDLVFAEGAGSPAEINLRHRDIANMAVALHVSAPVLIVADIDRGGVFAHLVGTMELLSEEERRLVGGFVVNRFRGDATLLEPGIRMLEERYGVPVLGVLPYLDGWRGDEEDSLGIEEAAAGWGSEAGGSETGSVGGALTIAAIRLPYVSNFTDVAALAAEPDVAVRWVRVPADLDRADAIVIPGSKSTAADLEWLRSSGLAAAIVDAVEEGVAVIGVCGGYQMLGTRIEDPLGIEGGDVEGLGLLDAVTQFAAEKRTVLARGKLTGAALAPVGTHVRGYEIHMGRTTLGPAASPLMSVAAADGELYDDGAASVTLRVCGTYLHGLFDAPQFRRTWLDGLRERKGLQPLERAAGETASVPDPLDRLADMLEEHLDLSAIEQLLGLEAAR
jgi:adenosylcobyric acid synthase